MAKMKSYANLDTNQDAATGGNFYTGDVPPAGTYRCVVKFVKVKTNKNGDDMLNVLAEIREPKSSTKAKFNGYGIFNNLNVTDQGVPYVKAFWLALGADPDAFFKGVGSIDTTVTPPRIVKVGRKMLTDEDPVVITCKRTEYPVGSGEMRLEVRQYLAADGAADEDEDDDVEVIDDEDVYDDDVDVEADEDEDEADDEDADEDESEEDEDEEADDEEAEEEEGYTAEDLADLSIIELKGILKDGGWTPADYKGYTRDDLTAAILGDEDEDEDADDAEGDDEPPF